MPTTKPQMQFYKNESDAMKSHLKGPVEEINNGFLVFADDATYINWLSETEPIPVVLDMAPYKRSEF